MKQIKRSLTLFFICISFLMIFIGTAAAIETSDQNNLIQNKLIQSNLTPQTATSFSNNTTGVSFYFVSELNKTELNRTFVEAFAEEGIPVHVYQITKELTTDKSLPSNLKEKPALYKTYYIEPGSGNIIIEASDYQNYAMMNNWILNSSFIPDASTGFGAASDAAVTVEFGVTQEVNFYFDAPDWEYAINGVGIGISDLNQTAYNGVNLEEGIVYNTMGLFYTASENPRTGQNNNHITYIWLGSDINQNELRRYATNVDDASVRAYSCFNINKNKSGIIFDGSKDRSHKGGKVGYSQTREDDWHKWVQWFHYDMYSEAAGYVTAVRTSSTNTVPFEVKIQNSNLVGGNGYGFIFVTSAGKNITNHYSNVFYVGPQLLWNDNGLSILDDIEIIIDDPRYANNGVINYEDISGNPKTLTLNLNDSRGTGTAYWGEVGEVSGLKFRGNVDIYKTNTGDIVSMFWVRYFTQDVVIEDGAVVNLRYKNNNVNAALSGIFYGDVYFNVSVGNYSVWNVNSDNSFSTPRINNLILGNESKVTIYGSGNPVGTFMSISGNLTLNPDSEMTVLTTHRNDYRVLNIAGSVLLSDYSELNVTGNSNNSAMLNMSNLTLNPDSEAKILNNGYGTALYANNLTAREFSTITVALMNNTTNSSANVSNIQLDRVESAVFHNAGIGRGLNVRSAADNNMKFTNMEEINHWKIPNAAVYNAVSGIVSGVPTYNWSNKPDAENGFNVTAWVNVGGWIQSADRLRSENYTGSETLNNTTFSLVQLDGAVWNNKTTVTYEGLTGPFQVTLYWNDLNHTVNGGLVRYGLPVSADLNLQAMEPDYPYYDFVSWYSDSALTIPYDVDSTPVTKPIQLYGEWVSDGSVFIHYYPNGGSGSFEPISIIPPATHIVLDNSVTSFERPGYVFTNWNTKDDGTGAAYLPGESLSITDNTYLFAHWYLSEYSIDYKFETESKNPIMTPGFPANPDTYTIENTPLILLPAFAPGYTFLHWADENGDVVTELSFGSTGDRILTAVFEDEALVYPIVYDFKTESGNPLLTSGSSNNPDTYTVLETPFTLNSASADGYTFLRWEDENGSTVTEINSGSVGGRKFTAVFDDDEIRYSITYSFETESGSSLAVAGISSNPDSYSVSETPFILNAAVASGYSFLRWEDETGSVIAEIGAGSTGSRNLKAVFSDHEIIYSLTYEFKTESGSALATSGISQNPETYTVSGTPLYLNDAAAFGYTFLRWEENGMAVTNIPAGSTGHKTLTAVFDNNEIVYAIHYAFKTESGNALSTTASSNNPASYIVSDTPFALNAASASGYSFLYWTDESGNIISGFLAGSTGRRDLIAVFSDDESVFGIQYKFETENGSVLKTAGATDNPRSYTVSDTPFNLRSASAPGYVFLYWKNESGSIVTGVDAGSTGNRIFTAVFDDDEVIYSVNYSFKTENGGSLLTLGSSLNPVSYTVSDTPFTLQAASADGYHFIYWADENGSVITGIDAGSVGNRDLTAVFSDNEIIYSLTYEFKTESGASLATSGSSVNPGTYTVSDTPFILSAASASGYTFMYWADENGLQIFELSAGSFGDRRLTAVFSDSEIVYSINYKFETESGAALAVSGSSENPSSYVVSDTPFVLNAATAAGYSFLRWIDESGAQTTGPAAGSVGSRTFTAVFSDDEIIYVIVYDFETESGESLVTTPSANNPALYTVSEMPLPLADATAAGYTFLYWKNETGAVVTEISQGTRILNGPSIMSDYELLRLGSSLNSYSAVVSLNNLSREAAEFTDTRIRDRELTAVFDDRPIVYTIDYLNTAVSEHSNPASYTVEETIILANASRSGSQFLGWFNDSSLSEEITQIGPKMTGDLNIYASWHENNTSGGGSGGGGSGGTGNGSVVDPDEPGNPGEPGPGEPEGPEEPEEPSGPDLPDGGIDAEQTAAIIILLILAAICVFLFVWKETKDDEIENVEEENSAGKADILFKDKEDEDEKWAEEDLIIEIEEE